MALEAFERKLAAVLAADVVGYSRLMGADEAGTHARLRDLRKGFIEPKLAEHRGRVVKLTGDGAIVQSASVVDAVRCAVEIQQGVARQSVSTPEHERIVFRIGINLSDVILDEDDIYGDGVNIAARLEGLAPPGGLCIADVVHQMIRGRLDVAFKDLGERRVKNIAEPVHVWRWINDAPATVPLSGEAGTTLRLPDKPSIAVLPFGNLSRDPEQDYFSDGMTEDLITDLSRISGLFVIARNSSFRFKGQSVDPKQVGKDLGVRYLLEGSVRRAANRIRINAQLIDASTGFQLWAERYDRDLEDVFALQDEITQTIVAALEVHLTPSESEGIARRYTDDLEAYDLFLRALDHQARRTSEGATKARETLEQAIALDPGFAAAYARLAENYNQEWVHSWRADEGLLDRALELARVAVRLDDRLPLAHTILAWTHLWRKEHGPAIAEAKRGLALDPNHAEGHARFGRILDFAGRPLEGLPHIEKALRLDPHYPFTYPFYLGQTLSSLQRYGEAVDFFRRSIGRNPALPPAHYLLAVAYAHLGRMDDARGEVAEALQLVPDLSIHGLANRMPYRDQAVLTRVMDGLRKAGLPE